MTAAGPVPIEQVQIGDPVWAFDEESGKLIVTPVLQTLVNTDVPIFDVVITHADGTREIIHTTAGHPFYVKDRGWVPAMYLGSGDTLSNLAGELSTNVEVVNTGRRETVYNLSVADANTYFVGERGVLVHNICWPAGPLTARQVIKILKKNGYNYERHHGGHAIYIKPGKPNPIPVPIHGGNKPIKRGTMGNIKRMCKANGD